MEFCGKYCFTSIPTFPLSFSDHGICGIYCPTNPAFLIDRGTCCFSSHKSLLFQQKRDLQILFSQILRFSGTVVFLDTIVPHFPQRQCAHRYHCRFVLLTTLYLGSMGVQFTMPFQTIDRTSGDWCIV